MDRMMHLRKMYADDPNPGTRGNARPGFQYSDRELDALEGPFVGDEAIAACAEMPYRYGEFTRDALLEAVETLREEYGVEEFYFGREGSVVIYFVADMTETEMHLIFGEADEIDPSTNPLTKTQMQRVWWD